MTNGPFVLNLRQDYFRICFLMIPFMSAFHRHSVCKLSNTNQHQMNIFLCFYSENTHILSDVYNSNRFNTIKTHCTTVENMDISRCYKVHVAIVTG